MPRIENTPTIFPEYEKALKNLPKRLRDLLPISITDKGVVISTFISLIWDFYPYIHTKNPCNSQKRIDFRNLIFDDGSQFTDPRHARLLNSVKMFFYTRLSHPHPHSGKTLKHQTITSIWSGFMPPLLRWMVAEGYTQFADLTPMVCRSYVEHCKMATGWVHSKNLHKRKPLSDATMQSRFSLLEDLNNFREHLEDTIPEHPWPNESSCLLSGKKRGGGNNQCKTEVIPDRLFRKLAKGALRYIETDYGQGLLDYRDARDAGEPLKAHLTGLNLRDKLEANNEINNLQTACYAVIALFSGLRDSEMASLELGCYREHEGWDNAIYSWIDGISYKTELEPKSTEWMVPPVVEKAVNLAERACAPLRNEVNRRCSGTGSLDTSLDYAA